MSAVKHPTYIMYNPQMARQNIKDKSNRCRFQQRSCASLNNWADDLLQHLIDLCTLVAVIDNNH